MSSSSSSSSTLFLQRLDAFSKPRQDLRSQSVVGGLITMIASVCAAGLFVAQVYLYVRGTPHHSLLVSPSQPHPLMPLTHPAQVKLMEQRKPKLPIQFKVTFAALECDKLDVAHDSASYRAGELERLYGPQVVTFRRPTVSEWAAAVINNNNKSKQQQQQQQHVVALDRQHACTVEGSLAAPLVAGHLTITLAKHAWAEASSILIMHQVGVPQQQQQQQQRQQPDQRIAALLAQYNTSHFVHYLKFGKLPTQLSSSNNKNPLQDMSHDMADGLALEQLNIKLIPTLQPSIFSSSSSARNRRPVHYQPSVAAHTVKQLTLIAQAAVPGLSVIYDITPLTVHQTLGREHVLIFLSSLMSIVGGAFVCVSLLTGCLVHATAAAVSKKID